MGTWVVVGGVPVVVPGLLPGLRDGGGGGVSPWIFAKTAAWVVWLSDSAVTASWAAVSRSPNWFQNWLFWVFQSRWAAASERSGGCCGGRSPECFAKPSLAFWAWRTACAACWNAAAPSRISSARSAIFVAEWLNAVLAALALSPLNRWSVPIWPDRVSSWLANWRSRLSPVFHCWPAVSREPSFALAT